MSLFRSRKDIEFAKRINRELIERVIGETFLLFPFSKEFSETNIYGEAKKKIFDAPIEISGLVKWNEQEATTTKFGQDLIYSLEIDVLQEMLEILHIKIYEGDCIEWDHKRFEIVKIIDPSQFYGRSDENVGYKLFARTMRESNFTTLTSGSVKFPDHTNPDLNLPVNDIGIQFDSVKFPYSGSRNDE